MQRIGRILTRAGRRGQPWTVGWLLGIVGGIAFLGCDPPRTAPPQLLDAAKLEANGEMLHSAIWSRLALMPSVAYAKFVDQRPITDRTRETELIDRFRAAADLRGISPDFAEAVIRGQIEASKLVQQRLYEDWQAHPPGADWTVRSLNNDLRPAIDETHDRLLVALQQLGTQPDAFPALVEQLSERRQPLPPNVTEEAWSAAWWPLRTATLPYLVPRAGRVLRGPSTLPTLPQHQPLLPDFAPEPQEATP